MSNLVSICEALAMIREGSDNEGSGEALRKKYVSDCKKYEKLLNDTYKYAMKSLEEFSKLVESEEEYDGWDSEALDDVIDSFMRLYRDISSNWLHFGDEGNRFGNYYFTTNLSETEDFMGYVKDVFDLLGNIKGEKGSELAYSVKDVLSSRSYRLADKFVNKSLKEIVKRL